MIKIINMFLAFEKDLDWKIRKVIILLFASKVCILLLACVSEAFRKESLNFLELGPFHYLSTPGYTWEKR